MQFAEKALKSLDEFEAARQQAIEELLAAKNDIESKLIRIGYDGTPPKKEKKTKCGECGSTEHTARFHRKNPSPDASEGQSSL